MPSPELEKGPAYARLKAMNTHTFPPWELPDEASWPKESDPPDADVLREVRMMTDEDRRKLIVDLILFVKNRMASGPCWVRDRKGVSNDGRTIHGEGLLDPVGVAIDAMWAALTGKGISGKRKRRPGQRLRQYILGIARSFVYHQARGLRGVSQSQKLLEPLASDSYVPEKRLECAETIADIREVLAKNPEFAPVVDWLISKGQEQQDQVAARHGISRAQLGKLTWKAMPKLRDLLAEHRP